MAVKLETETIRVMALFEKLTKVHSRDCIVSDTSIYFIVNPSKIGLAIGKNGSVINEVRKVVNKQVKIIGYYEDPELFIKNMFPKARGVEINDGSAFISIQNKDRPMIIGKNGENIKVLKKILKRHFSITDVKLR